LPGRPACQPCPCPRGLGVGGGRRPGWRKRKSGTGPMRRWSSTVNNARHVPGRTNLLPIRSASFVAAITDALSKTWVKCDYWSGNPFCSLPLPLFGSKEPPFFFPSHEQHAADYSTTALLFREEILSRAFAPRKTEIIAHSARVWLQDSGAAVRACVPPQSVYTKSDRSCMFMAVGIGQLAAPNPNHWTTTQLMIRCV